MNQNEQELEDEYASDRVPLGQTFTILCVWPILCSYDAIRVLPYTATIQASIQALLLCVGEAPSDVIEALDEVIYERWTNFPNH